MLDPLTAHLIVGFMNGCHAMRRALWTIMLDIDHLAINDHGHRLEMVLVRVAAAFAPLTCQRVDLSLWRRISGEVNWLAAASRLRTISKNC